MNKPSFFAELQRRNVLRAGAFYTAAVWALAQGIAQLGPSVGAPDGVTRWFLVAAAIGFPFWLAFAWFYEFTPSGLKRESAIAPRDSIAHSTGRKLDFWIIGTLAIAVVLLLTNQFVSRRDAGGATAAAVAAIPVKSVAVLPLANESGDKGEQYFSDGLSEDLITALSQFDGLKVISRNSSFQFRDSKDSSRLIGEKLGVAHLLEGSVRRAGGEVRITAELVNAVDGSTLWSQRYDRPYRDLFKLQDDITTAVAAALKARLLSETGMATQSDRPPGGNLEAWNAYVRGNFHLAGGSEADTRAAIGQYRAAIMLDPRYGRAYAALSLAWARLGTIFLGGDEQRHAYAEARAAVGTALELNPDSAAALGVRGYLGAYAEFDWVAAEADYRRALQQMPNDGAAKYALGSLLATLGQPERAVALIEQALTTDPRQGGWYYTLAQIHASVGQLDQATQAIRTAIALQPHGAANHEQLTIIEILRGDGAAALHAAQQEPDILWRDVALALAAQNGGDRAAAEATLKILIDKDANGSAYQIAEVYALRGDRDNMFAWLQRAWSGRDAGISSLLIDPLILRYRDDPRFAAFCRKVGLPLPSEKPPAAPPVHPAPGSPP